MKDFAQPVASIILNSQAEHKGVHFNIIPFHVRVSKGPAPLKLRYALCYPDMIGVISKPPEREVVEEFFQLFKTPWEFYDPSQQYEVLLVTNEKIPDTDASLIVVYGTEKKGLDECDETGAVMQSSDVFLEWDNAWLPIYGKAVTFSNPDRPILFCSKSGEPIGYETYKGEQRILRIGYDLFHEILFLLTKGQPPQNALIPMLDLHIAMLRNWIIEKRVPLVEIPPVPAGYKFAACLTHDVDFVGIRKHKFDHTMWGFLYRASVGSLLSFLKGRYSLSRLIRNWKAILSLPAIYLGLCKDFWLEFDRYLAIEKDFKSTFFLIPFKNLVGEKVSRRNPRRRATRYDITDVQEWAKELTGRGYEIGVHAIDAWHNPEKGVQELKRISEVTRKTHLGVRTHWLCFNEYSPEILEEAGFYYDSTFGYNESPGYRAGTTQVFKPFGAKNLLELPLHIQDKSLLNSRRSPLTEEQAWKVCVDFFNQLSLYGGVLTILWHMRSLSPEKCWDDFYVRLLGELKKRRAWIASAGQVVEWFWKRRKLSFRDVSYTGDKLSLSLNLEADIPNPNFVVRVHIPSIGVKSSYNHVDIPLSQEKRIEISF